MQKNAIKPPSTMEGGGGQTLCDLSRLSAKSHTSTIVPTQVDKNAR